MTTKSTKKTTRRRITKTDASSDEEVKVGKDTKPNKTKGDKIDNSFYKGKGGCYTLNEEGLRVPVKEE